MKYVNQLTLTWQTLFKFHNSKGENYDLPTPGSKPASTTELEEASPYYQSRVTIDKIIVSLGNTDVRSLSHLKLGGLI